MVAEFSGMDLNNYNPIDPISATLIVSQKVIKISDSVKFESKTVNFDENITHYLEATGFPEDRVKVEYENNGQKYAGEYEVKAKFSAKNSTETVDVTELTAFLIVNKVKRAVMAYNTTSHEYDRPIEGSDISIVNGKAQVSNFETDLYAVDTINFYELDDNQLIEPANFVNGTTYSFSITFVCKDETINSSVELSFSSGNFTYIAA